MMISQAIYLLTQQIEHCLSEITQHPDFQSLESRWRSLNQLVHTDEINALLFITDTTYLKSKACCNHLFNIIEHDYLRSTNNDPISVLILDSDYHFDDQSLSQLAKLCFLPILSHSIAKTAHLLIQLKARRLVRQPYFYESTDSIANYLWGHAGYYIIQQFFRNYSQLSTRFQSWSSATSLYRHVNTDANALLETLFFCRIVHAIQQMLRHQIGKPYTDHRLLNTLRNWLNQYTSQTANQYPLKSSDIDITCNHPDRYDCIIRLTFHQHPTPFTASLTLDR